MALSNDSYSTQIIKFEKILTDQPKSQVFAPLSELYCKVGLFEKAMDILKKGIRYNPSYVLGYIALASCYHMKGEMQLAYSTLLPLVGGQRDNIKMQLLFAKIAKDTGNLEESLDTYKYLHFLKPNDPHIAKCLAELETMTATKETESLDQSVQFDLDHINTDEVNSQDFDEWEQVNLTSGVIDDRESLDEEWTTNEMSENEVILSAPQEQQKQPSQDKDDSALFTHTLVDLYLTQGHRERAIDILNKILELRPNDQRTIEKLLAIKSEAREGVAQTEKDGHQVLSESLDNLFDHDRKDEILAPLHEFSELILSKKKETTH